MDSREDTVWVSWGNNTTQIAIFLLYLSSSDVVILHVKCVASTPHEIELRRVQKRMSTFILKIYTNI